MDSKGCAAVYMTLALDLLRDKIVQYAMCHGNGTLCSKYIANLRLVAKSWQASVSNTLARTREPLYHLTIDKNKSSTCLPFVATQSNLLDKFVTAVNLRIENPFPTIRLKILENYFHKDNFESLYAFLLQCGRGLVELELQIPINAGTLPCQFPQISLPLLKKVRVEFSKTHLANSDNSNDSKRLPNVTLFLVALFNATTNLSELVFPCNKIYHNIPLGFQNISLPPSIQNLEFSCLMSGNEPEILITSSFENLSSLTLMIANSPYPEYLFTKILTKLRNTLQMLHIRGCCNPSAGFRTLGNGNVVNFPVMEKLEVLKIFCTNWKLQTDTISIGLLFPKLRCLDLCYQTKKMFYKWTSGSPCLSLEAMVINLVDKRVPITERGFHLPLLAKDMQCVHITFPNIRILMLQITIRQTCGLQYIFKEMQNLAHLAICVVEADLCINADTWDSILIGVPEYIVAKLRKHAEFLQYFYIKEDVPSIKMLTSLTSLNLESINKDVSLGQDTDNSGPPLISDFAFDFGLNKMSNLKNLVLKGRFKPSSSIKEAWKASGRNIFYLV